MESGQVKAADGAQPSTSLALLDTSALLAGDARSGTVGVQLKKAAIVYDKLAITRPCIEELARVELASRSDQRSVDVNDVLAKATTLIAWLRNSRFIMEIDEATVPGFEAMARKLAGEMTTPAQIVSLELTDTRLVLLSQYIGAPIVTNDRDLASRVGHPGTPIELPFPFSDEQLAQIPISEIVDMGAPVRALFRASISELRPIGLRRSAEPRRDRCRAASSRGLGAGTCRGHQTGRHIQRAGQTR